MLESNTLLNQMQRHSFYYMDIILLPQHPFQTNHNTLNFPLVNLDQNLINFVNDESFELGGLGSVPEKIRKK